MQIACKESFYQMEESYLFAAIAKEVECYKAKHPKSHIISLGIGDATLPLPDVVIQAMKKAANEMGESKSFRGYGPSDGYLFLKQAIQKQYERRGCHISPEEILITDGAKGTLASLCSIWERGLVLLPTPNYPVYRDLAIFHGFSIEEIKANEENSYLPLPPDPKNRGYLIFLCSPGNPTGKAYSKADLEQWVSFAKESGSLILFDAAYEAFLGQEDIHSIFEITGAKDCTIEIGSFSKSVGFTGMRCGWLILPKALRDSKGSSLHSRFSRYLATTCNGVSYITQRGAEAALGEEGLLETKERIAYYLRNAACLKQALCQLGLEVSGGEVSPYLWVNPKNGRGSWEIFKQLFTFSQIVSTPGVGFGRGGEGYIRLSAFGKREEIEAACGRFCREGFGL